MPYDFTDGQVYLLVKTTHLPVEERASEAPDAHGVYQLVLRCSKDGEVWPCSAVQQVRKFDRQGVVEALRQPLPFTTAGAPGATAAAIAAAFEPGRRDQ